MKRVLLLTGGTGKFGQVFVPYFLKNGWQVVVTGRNEEKLNYFLTMHSNFGKLTGLVIDFAKTDAVKELLSNLSEQNLVITHLVNNARSLEALKINPDGKTDRENFLREFEIDVITSYELSIELSRSCEHKIATIVNIGSMYGQVVPNPKLYKGSLLESPIQYGVSKAAVHQLTKELAVRLSPMNIRVNCVAYGGVEGRVDDSFKERYGSLVPNGRMLREDEIIGPLDFLLNDESSAVNGHILVADGGWSIW